MHLLAAGEHSTAELAQLFAVGRSTGVPSPGPQQSDRVRHLNAPSRPSRPDSNEHPRVTAAAELPSHALRQLFGVEDGLTVAVSSVDGPSHQRNSPRLPGRVDA